MFSRWITLSLLFPLTVIAQSDVQVPTISVIGAARDKSEVKPTRELGGSRLRRKKQATVGESLTREPGVASTQFGPNASRPILRGQEGERTRVLQNGTGVLDASTASDDHAVAIDPLTVERVELVRGPGALVYGPHVVGGVVNLITNRIPEAKNDRTTGLVDLRGSTNENQRALGATVNVPLAERIVFHADGSARAADDYYGPKSERVKNSFQRTGSGALGLSYLFERGFIGASFSDYESTYGTVAEESVHINLLQQRFDTRGEIRDFAGFDSVRLKNSYSNYRHDEMEEGSRATTFKNLGNETRLDFKHAPVLGFHGGFGLESRVFDFSAQGEERFLPNTANRLNSFFWHEEWQGSNLKPSLALRLEDVNVQSKDEIAPFEKRSVNFNPTSVAAGLSHRFTDTWTWTLTGAYTERAPNYQELFANGPHVVVEAYEQGNANLKKERSQSVEVGINRTGELGSLAVSAFLADTQGYVALSPTGTVDGASGFDIYQYQAVEARLMGGELEWKQILLSSFAGGTLESELKLDLLNGKNRRTGDHLPRITPMRETLSLLYKSDRWETEMEVQRSEEQSKTAPNESKTGAYTLVNVHIEVPLRWGGTAFNLTGRANNIFDVEAKNHVASRVVKDIAPLPGRTFVLGLQVAF